MCVGRLLSSAACLQVQRYAQLTQMQMCFLGTSAQTCTSAVCPHGCHKTRCDEMADCCSSGKASKRLLVLVVLWLGQAPSGRILVWSYSVRTDCDLKGLSFQFPALRPSSWSQTGAEPSLGSGEEGDLRGSPGCLRAVLPTWPCWVSCPRWGHCTVLGQK